MRRRDYDHERDIGLPPIAMASTLTIDPVRSGGAPKPVRPSPMHGKTRG